MPIKKKKTIDTNILGKLKEAFSPEGRALRWMKKQEEQYVQREAVYNDKLRDAAQQQKFIDTMDKIRPPTYTKKMVTVIIAVAMIDINLPFLFAFMGLQYENLMPLASELTRTILGVAFVYMVRAYFDSRAEHKNIDYSIKSEIESGIFSKVSEIFADVGITVNNKDLFRTSEAQEDEEEDALSPGLHINKS